MVPGSGGLVTFSALRKLAPFPVGNITFFNTRADDGSMLKEEEPHLRR
jgi:hypothetical protein